GGGEIALQLAVGREREALRGGAPGVELDQVLHQQDDGLAGLFLRVLPRLAAQLREHGHAAFLARELLELGEVGDGQGELVLALVVEQDAVDLAAAYPHAADPGEAADAVAFVHHEVAAAQRVEVGDRHAAAAELALARAARDAVEDLVVGEHRDALRAVDEAAG